MGPSPVHQAQKAQSLTMSLTPIPKPSINAGFEKMWAHEARRLEPGKNPPCRRDTCASANTTDPRSRGRRGSPGWDMRRLHSMPVVSSICRFGTSSLLNGEFANVLARIQSSSIVSRLAGDISPVLAQKFPAVADVLRLLCNVFETVVLAHEGVKCADSDVLVGTPKLAIAVVALDAMVEGVETSFMLVELFPSSTGMANVPEKTCRLNPFRWSTS